jgi:hypothetical protein
MTKQTMDYLEKLHQQLIDRGFRTAADLSDDTHDDVRRKTEELDEDEKRELGIRLRQQLHHRRR